MPATDGTWRTTRTRFAAHRPHVALLVVVSESVALALGLFLVVRRATGALASPLPTLPLVATAMILILWTLLFQLAWRASQVTTTGEPGTTTFAVVAPDALFTLWLPLLTTFCFAGTCSYPGDRLVDWLVWPAAITVLVWSSRVLSPARRSSPARARCAAAADLMLQQITRYRTAEGNEAVRGTVVAEFAVGQRDATLFVAFCPPFERLPDVEAHLDDNSQATVKVAQRLHHGTQLEVRLAEQADEPLTVTVQFIAAEPDRPPAA